MNGKKRKLRENEVLFTEEPGQRWIEHIRVLVSIAFALEEDLLRVLVDPEPVGVRLVLLKTILL
jgi:hypothetical protein